MRKAFTLIELIVSLLIVSISIYILMISMGNVTKNINVILSYFSQDKDYISSKMQLSQKALTVLEIMTKKGADIQPPSLEKLNDSVSQIEFSRTVKDTDLYRVYELTGKYKDVRGNEKEEKYYIVIGKY